MLLQITVQTVKLQMFLSLSSVLLKSTHVAELDVAVRDSGEHVPQSTGLIA